RLPAAGLDWDAPDAAPVPGRCPPPHAVPREPADDREDRGRDPGFPGLRAAVARPLLLGGGGAVPAGRARPDQPDLALGPVPHLAGNERRAAGLVPGMADRGAAARAEFRRHDRELHADPESVLGRGAVPADRV